jgi:geranylgeranyl pyrophosphate synthase
MHVVCSSDSSYNSGAPGSRQERQALHVVQVVDDLLDFTQTAEQLGKPRYQDIASGNLTAPTLFAMQKSPELLEIMESEFVEKGSLERAVELVEANGGKHQPLLKLQWQCDMKKATRKQTQAAFTCVEAEHQMH